MDPRTVADRRGELQILDVREDEEWAAGHIDGAVHIPLGQLPQRIGELDAQRPVVTVCRSGGRAGRAADLLTSSGRRAAVMDGGMQRWGARAFPPAPPTAAPEPSPERHPTAPGHTRPQSWTYCAGDTP
jgi:rhodanese-related sulfurtransferase